MTSIQPQGFEMCPNCGKPMPVFAHTITWCEDCDYGLRRDSVEAKKKSVYEKFYEDLGKKRGKEIYDRLAHEKNLDPTRNFNRLVVVVLAVMVHLFSLMCFGCGLFIFVKFFGLIFVDFLALLMIGFAWVARPKPIPVPQEGLLNRPDYPDIYKLVDQVAEALGARIDHVVIDESFNAGYISAGWNRKSVIMLGLPLWDILADQERIALIGHEIAHSINGDSSRGFLVGTALRSLSAWFEFIMPSSILPHTTGILNYLAIPFRLIAFGIAMGILGLYKLMGLLLYQDMQRAEYLADQLAIRVGGKEAFGSMLKKFIFDSTFRIAVQHCALNSQKKDVFIELHELIEKLPEREIIRRWRLELIENSHLEATHPPIIFRLKLSESYPVEQARILADPVLMKNVDEKFSGLRQKVQTRLIDQYLTSIE
jgi:heat shock protein HtpX